MPYVPDFVRKVAIPVLIAGSLAAGAFLYCRDGSDEPTPTPTPAATATYKPTAKPTAAPTPEPTLAPTPTPQANCLGDMIEFYFGIDRRGKGEVFGYFDSLPEPFSGNSHLPTTGDEGNFYVGLVNAEGEVLQKFDAYEETTSDHGGLVRISSIYRLAPDPDAVGIIALDANDNLLTIEERRLGSKGELLESVQHDTQYDFCPVPEEGVSDIIPSKYRPLNDWWKKGI